MNTAMPQSDVFLFGAGASHGARTVDPPPLGKDLHIYVQKYLCEAWEELGFLEEPDDGTRTDKTRAHICELLSTAGSYETLATHLLERGQQDLLGKLNLLMAYALTPPINDDPRTNDAFTETCDIYDGFLAKNFSDERNLQSASFITLNYDCLLERAICRHLGHNRPRQSGEWQCRCQHIKYFDDTLQGIEVLKPHGSINWVPDHMENQPYVEQPIVTIRTTTRGKAIEYRTIKAVDSPREGYGEVIVAHYAHRKLADVNPRRLQSIRDLAIQ